jgi:hypothetical protein
VNGVTTAKLIQPKIVSPDGIAPASSLEDI